MYGIVGYSKEFRFYVINNRGDIILFKSFKVCFGCVVRADRRGLEEVLIVMWAR